MIHEKTRHFSAEFTPRAVARAQQTSDSVQTRQPAECSAGFAAAGPMIGTSAMFADLALIAVATEAIIGYPDALYRFVGHPVTWIGRLIEWCDQAWNSPKLSFETRRWRGVATLLLLLVVAIAVGVATTSLLAHLFPALLALVIAGVLASSLLAQRSLDA